MLMEDGEMSNFRIIQAVPVVVNHVDLLCMTQ